MWAKNECGCVFNCWKLNKIREGNLSKTQDSGRSPPILLHQQNRIVFPQTSPSAHICLRSIIVNMSVKWSLCYVKPALKTLGILENNFWVLLFFFSLPFLPYFPFSIIFYSISVFLSIYVALKKFRNYIEKKKTHNSIIEIITGLVCLNVLFVHIYLYIFNNTFLKLFSMSRHVCLHTFLYLKTHDNSMRYYLILQMVTETKELGNTA